MIKNYKIDNWNLNLKADYSWKKVLGGKMNKLQHLLYLVQFELVILETSHKSYNVYKIEIYNSRVVIRVFPSQKFYDHRESTYKMYLSCTIIRNTK